MASGVASLAKDAEGERAGCLVSWGASFSGLVLGLACAQCVGKPAIVWSNNRRIWIWMPTNTEY